MDYNPAPIGLVSFVLAFGGLALFLAVFFLISDGLPLIKKAATIVWSSALAGTQVTVNPVAATPASATPASATPAVVPPPLTGPVRYDGRWYSSCEAAAGYLRVPQAIIEAAVSQDPSAQADAFWRGPQTKIARFHRVLKVGRTHSRVFVREYDDHQSAYVRRKDGIFQIHGRFTRGQSGDDAILRLAAAI